MSSQTPAVSSQEVALVGRGNPLWLPFTPLWLPFTHLWLPFRAWSLLRLRQPLFHSDDLLELRVLSGRLL